MDIKCETDEEFAEKVQFAKELEGLAKVTSLALMGKITDAGLGPLWALTNLETLDLDGTKITDAGLVHLKGLSKLKRLELYSTKITDAGLVHLKGLTKLELLYLKETEITDAGVKDLKEALPDCRTIRER